MAAALRFLRFSHNPDEFGCLYLDSHLDLSPENLDEEAFWREIGEAKVKRRAASRYLDSALEHDLPEVEYSTVQ